MSLSSTYDPNDIPWQLIAASLQGELEAEERAQLEQWLSQSPDNREKYGQCQRLWEEGLAGYEWYRQADASAAWESLQSRGGREPRPKVIPMKKWIAAAAAVVLVAGAGWWYLAGQVRATQYETAENEQKTVTLPDGSSISLQSGTVIRVADDYNKTGRTVTLARGEALFEVQHQAQWPFVVNMGTSSVKDLATNFTVRKTPDSVRVTVHAGKVAFVKNRTGEQRELSGGMALSFHAREENFGEIVPAGQAGAVGVDDSSFQDAPLGEILAAMEKVYGKKIQLEDTSLAQKKFTIRLAGEPFDTALKTVCASLNLGYTEKNGVFILKNR